LVIGIIGCSKSLICEIIWKVYRSVFGSIPTLLVLFFIYFGAPGLISELSGKAVEVSPFAAGLVGLSLIYATYIAEVIRGAVFAVPKGQYEASKALGLGPVATWGRVIAPQVIKISLPGLINTWVVLLKDTALVSVIGVSDVVRVGQIAGSATGRPLLYLGVVGLFFVVVVTLSLGLVALRGGRRRMASGAAK
jgi:polar amino acid transport system permease protein